MVIDTGNLKVYNNRTHRVLYSGQPEPPKTLPSREGTKGFCLEMSAGVLVAQNTERVWGLFYPVILKIGHFV